MVLYHQMTLNRKRGYIMTRLDNFTV